MTQSLWKFVKYALPTFTKKVIFLFKKKIKNLFFRENTIQIFWLIEYDNIKKIIFFHAKHTLMIFLKKSYKYKEIDNLKEKRTLNL